jgi:hypothetical protein
MVETKKKGCRGKQPFGSKCYRLFGGRDGASSSDITQPKLRRSQSRRGNRIAGGELTRQSIATLNSLGRQARRAPAERSKAAVTGAF